MKLVYWIKLVLH